nr:ethanolamine ammonia-lyase subunit EutB [Desulfosarcina cetonica]
MKYTIRLDGRHFDFKDLKTVMAKASPERSGDRLAGIAADTDLERVAAQMVLAEAPLTRFLEEPLIPYEIDEVTRLILDDFDDAAFTPIRHLSVGGLRDWLCPRPPTARPWPACAWASPRRWPRRSPSSCASKT